MCIEDWAIGANLIARTREFVLTQTAVREQILTAVHNRVGVDFWGEATNLHVTLENQATVNFGILIPTTGNGGWLQLRLPTHGIMVRGEFWVRGSAANNSIYVVEYLAPEWLMRKIESHFIA